MMSIATNELMELFVDTLQKCGTHILKMNDEYIGYYIFEEVCIGVISFLHDSSLIKLKDAGLISEIISQKSAELRKKIMALENTDLWNVNSVKCSKEWREILKLSDEIKEFLM